MIRPEEFYRALELQVCLPTSRKGWDFQDAAVNRPGLQFCGFYDHFAFERPQIIGKVEYAFLTQLPAEEQLRVSQRFCSYAVPCVIFCRGQIPPRAFLREAEAHDVAVCLTDKITTKICYECTAYLNRSLAPQITQHGVMVDVHGVGVLITGESGVGKSETALELVKRGHQLVADDVVDIRRVSDTRLIGQCPETIRHLMEIRGLGIIDIRAMYGVSAVVTSKTIDLVIHLEPWVEGKEYDRLGLEDDHVTILGVQVPQLITPVRPGRNLAIIVEVAARNLSLKRLGYSAAHELDRRLNAQYDQTERDSSLSEQFEGGTFL